MNRKIIVWVIGILIVLAATGFVSAVENGAGLGLAIVKKIVKVHKGRVWVEDNPGGGSIFCALIPMG